MSDDSSNPPVVVPKKPQAWHPVWALLIVLAGYASQYIAGLAVVFGSLLFVDHSQIKDWLQTPAAQFIAVLISEVFALLVILFFLKRRKLNLAKSFGLRRTNPVLAIFMGLMGFGVYMILLIGSSALEQFLPFIKPDETQALGFDQHVGGVGLVLAFASLIILPPLAEEMIFRGFLFGSLRKYLRFGWALLITSALFGFLHVFTGADGLLWSAAIDTFLLSAVLCYVREKTGSIWATMLIHALKNTLAFLYLFILHR